MLIQLINNLNQQRVFTLADNFTLRILAKDSKIINEKQVTPEIERNIANGLLVKNLISEDVESKIPQSKSKSKK